MLFKKITTETSIGKSGGPYLKRETKLYFLGILIYKGNTVKSYQDFSESF